MLSEFGKLTRVIRIQNNEILLDMAKKLGVTSSYLSAVENGKRSVPGKWVDKIRELYSLNGAAVQELKEAAEASSRSVRLDLSNADQKKKNLAIAFARSFENLDEESIKRIQKALDGSRSKGGKKNK